LDYGSQEAGLVDRPDRAYIQTHMMGSVQILDNVTYLVFPYKLFTAICWLRSITYVKITAVPINWLLDRTLTITVIRWRWRFLATWSEF